jgi:hypothetical protein
MPSAGFETAIPSIMRIQTRALDRMAQGSAFLACTTVPLRTLQCSLTYLITYLLNYLFT